MRGDASLARATSLSSGRFCSRNFDVLEIAPPVRRSTGHFLRFPARRPGRRGTRRARGHVETGSCCGGDAKKRKADGVARECGKQVFKARSCCLVDRPMEASMVVVQGASGKDVQEHVYDVTVAPGIDAAFMIGLTIVMEHS